MKYGQDTCSFGLLDGIGHNFSGLQNIMPEHSSKLQNTGTGSSSGRQVIGEGHNSGLYDTGQDTAYDYRIPRQKTQVLTNLIISCSEGPRYLRL